jgi:hypothetical protein
MNRALLVAALVVLAGCGKHEPWRESIMVWNGEKDLERARAEGKPTVVLFCREGAPDCPEEIVFRDRRLRSMLLGQAVPVRRAHPERTLPAVLGVYDANGRQTAVFDDPVDERVLVTAIEAARPLRW